MTTPNPYRKFLWMFGLIMPLGIALPLSLPIAAFYNDWIDGIMASTVLWLAMLPASFFIAWLATRRRCARNLTGIFVTAQLGFASGTGLRIPHYDSDRHHHASSRQLFPYGSFVYCIDSGRFIIFSRSLLVAEKSIGGKQTSAACITKYMQNAGSFAPVEQP